MRFCGVDWEVHEEDFAGGGVGGDFGRVGAQVEVVCCWFGE